ncbi:MAG: AgmX/PglI C-terminal domain-containing protein [Myxococcota bacterium]
MSDTTPPPPTSSGATYGIVGLLLVLGAVGLYCSSAEEETPEPTPVADPEPEPQRSNQFQANIEIPEEDLGVEMGEEEETGPAEPETPTMMSTMRRPPRECSGNLDVAAVQRVVRSQQSSVRGCYERRLKQNNLLQGTVNVSLVIGTDGKPSQVSVRGSLRDNEVFGCVRRLARNWEFPRPTGNSCARVNAPFNLTPRP